MVTADPEPAPREATNVLRLCFGLTEPVDRRTYAIAGFSLMLVKYVIDASIIYAVTRALWTPLDYLSPLMMTRTQKFGPGSNALQIAMVLWSLPFMWIGLVMTLRRAYDAGLPAGAGLVYFAPGFNYLAMLGLCCLPTQTARTHTHPSSRLPIGSLYSRGLVAILIASLATAALFAFSVYALRSYGSALFVGAPFVHGTISSFLYNRGQVRPLREALLLSLLGVVVVGGSLLLFAAEGAICLAMAAPLVLGISMLGTVVGRALAEFHENSYAVVSLPLLALLSASWSEAQLAAPTHYEVASSILIDAAPAIVWKHVTSFSELPEPDWPLFKLGLAYPVRASITGHGVGALRRCEFSTGAFVEPISAWDEPRRLAFDVSEQPPPMHEWSPYAHIHPPHLDGYFKSERGEFRLLPVENGGTRLEGSTWYELRYAPSLYWHLWSDFFVHRIHSRVLEHIKKLAEQDASAR